MATSAHVIDATDETFEAVVLKESETRPVVVDFWAPWCGPCRALGPTLERLADESGGKWLLVKVNTDENQRVAQSFQIRGIPAVKAFRGRKLVNEFTGVLPEGQIRKWLSDVVPSKAREDAEAALAALRRGDLDGAGAKADAALVEEPRLSAALIVKAEVSLARGDVDAAAAALDAIVDDEGLERAIALSRAKIDLARTVQGSDDEPALRQRLEAGPDPDAALGVAAYEALAGRIEAGFERALSVLTEHRKTHKEKAHHLALSLLALAPDDVQRDLRRKLSLVLF